VDRRFWLPVDHATELAHRALEQYGWTLTSENDWRLAWTLDLPSVETFTAATNGRWVNHLRGIAALTVKSHLCHNLRMAAGRASAVGAGALYAFAPQTFVLPGEWDEWMRARAWDPDAVWIQKPADLSRGRGVALVGHPDEVRPNLRQAHGRHDSHLVVQRYIANPHLLDDYKYSLRFYVAIVSLEPLIAYLFGDGFTKLASRPFSLAPEHRADRFRHLTNPDVLRDDPEAEGVSSRNTTHQQYRQRLREAGIDDGALFTRIRRVLAATLIAAQPAMLAVERAAGGTGRGQFELLGVDIAVDDRLEPWLLECNLAPSLSVEATAATAASRDEAAVKTQVVADTLRLMGVDEIDAPPEPPADPAGARARLAWHDRRCGGFERLWPSPVALETLAGAEHLGEIDRALLADEAGDCWPRVVANGVEAIDLGGQRLLFEPASDRITLLDADERESWSALTAAAAVAAGTAALHGVEWLRDGLLLPAGIAAATVRDAVPNNGLATRPRLRWNHEHVYVVHGLRIALQPASTRQAAALNRALAWWDAPDEDVVDATLFVPPRTAIPDVMAHIDRLALRRLGGVVRRRLTLATRGSEQVLVVGDGPEARRQFGEGWTLASHAAMIGGSPFGVWLDCEGRLEPLRVTAIAGHGTSAGDLLLDLVSAGAGVVCAFDLASVQSLARWIESLPIAGV